MDLNEIYCTIFGMKGGITMENRDKKAVAKVLTTTADKVLTITANSRCVFIFHQPKQPESVKKFRKF